MVRRRVSKLYWIVLGLLAAACAKEQPDVPPSVPTSSTVGGGDAVVGVDASSGYGDSGAPMINSQLPDATVGSRLDSATEPPVTPPSMEGGSPPLDAPDASPMADAAMAPSEPVLPPIDDPAEPGPFDVERIDRVDGLDAHSLFIPVATGATAEHPVVIWTNGNGGSLRSLSYASFVEHLASHGFFVIADKASNGSREAEVDSQGDAIEWALTETERVNGDFFGRLDATRIAVMGHSLGSLASFATASSEHVKTSVHFSGGITDNPVGFDPAWLQKMRRPAAFLCGGADSTAGPSCEKDFAMAPVPVFYGVLARASHIGPFTSQRGGEYGRAAVAWLRWQLADDDAFRSWFVGSDCVLCQSPWTAMQRDLE